MPRPPNAKVIRSLWIFRVKTKFDGSFERYKARLVGDGKSQREGIIVMRLLAMWSNLPLFALF